MNFCSEKIGEIKVSQNGVLKCHAPFWNGLEMCSASGFIRECMDSIGDFSSHSGSGSGDSLRLSLGLPTDWATTFLKVSLHSIFYRLASHCGPCEAVWKPGKRDLEE